MPQRRFPQYLQNNRINRSLEDSEEWGKKLLYSDLGGYLTY